MKRSGLLGIMIGDANETPPSPSPAAYFRKLSELGTSVGLDVVVFSPLETDWTGRRVFGYRWRSDRNAWEKTDRPFPDVVYDRSFCRNRRTYADHRRAAERLFRESGAIRLGRQLADKWETICVLSQHPELRPYLPPTAPLKRPGETVERLERTPAILLKPAGGSRGRNVLRIRRLADGRYDLCGRNARNAVVRTQLRSRDDLLRAVCSWTRCRPFLIQPFLALETADGRPFDLRVLVQKNGRGRWQISGMAARTGISGGITSNLHGGGTATPAAALLESEFGASTAAALLGRLRLLAVRVAGALECGFGRLAELGLDFGVDRDARVWILEANSKPGHTAFVRLADTGAGCRGAFDPWLQPVLYARTLIDRNKGRKPDESGNL